MKRWQVVGLALWSTIVLGYLGIFLGLRLLQTRLIFRPLTPVPALTPADLGWEAEAVTLTVPPASPIDHRSTPIDRLQGWWFPPHITTTSPKAWILFLGRRKTMADHGQSHALRYRIAALAGQSAGLLMLDYRGYGQSAGPHPTETRLYADGEAAWHFLRDTQGIAPDHIFFYGYSLGAAVALEMALRHPTAGGVVVDGGFTTLAETIDAHLSPHSPLRLFPLDLILTQPFDNASRVAQLQMPVLIVHGTADEVVPVELGKMLFAVASQPKEMILVTGANHESTAVLGGEQYLGALQRFLEQEPDY
ncbi:MAG: alpha/beta hydrolase [Prochlorothrix sp.]